MTECIYKIERTYWHLQSGEQNYFPLITWAKMPNKCHILCDIELGAFAYEESFINTYEKSLIDQKEQNLKERQFTEKEIKAIDIEREKQNTRKKLALARLKERLLEDIKNKKNVILSETFADKLGIQKTDFNFILPDNQCQIIKDFFGHPEKLALSSQNMVAIRLRWAQNY